MRKTALRQTPPPPKNTNSNNNIPPLLPPNQPPQSPLPLPKQPPQPRPPQKLMILILKPRHHRLGNQQPLTPLPALTIGQQKTRLPTPPLHNPLQPLPLRHIPPDNKRLHLYLPLGRGSRRRVDDDVAPPAAVQRVHGAGAVAMEVPLRGGRGEEVEDGG